MAFYLRGVRAGLYTGRLFFKMAKSINFRLLTFQASFFSLAANRSLLINLIYFDSLIVPVMVATGTSCKH